MVFMIHFLETYYVPHTALIFIGTVVNKYDSSFWRQKT